MTNEEKIRAYDEAIERAKKFHTPDSNNSNLKAVLELIFPKLAESEDEKIRKGLIEALKTSKTVGELKFILPEPTREECIAYLEKQKGYFQSGKGLYYYDGEKTTYLGYPSTEENPYDFAMSQQEEQKEQTPILEVFGFKVGDAVRLKDGDGRKHIIKSFERVEGLHGPDFYRVLFEDNTAADHIFTGSEYPDGHFTHMEKISEEKEQKPINESNMHEPTLDEARKWNEAYEKGYSLGYENGRNEQHLIEWSDTNELVFNDICKHLEVAGYSGWVMLLKALRNGEFQPKPEWSEEDEKALEREIDCVRSWEIDYCDGDNKISERLKSLRPQPEQEWTDDDEQHLKWLCRIIHSRKIHGELSLTEESELGNWIDKWINHNPQPHWKPSEEQMKALDKAIPVCMGVTVHDEIAPLESLYEQLKKLAE